MKLTETPALLSFFTTHFIEGDPSKDEETARVFMKTASREQQEQLISQIKMLRAETELPLDELGSEANRWFTDQAEAHAWLSSILDVFTAAQQNEVIQVKDANGTLLQENDSVHVIKDLKVKGGSSDLKRGTLIKRIHLTDDPEAIECRVDGSTLVLKTCFLKKA